MANTNAVANKGLEKLTAVLALIENGEYRVINGNLYKGNKRIAGSLGSLDMQRWYNVKGYTVQGQRLMYSYYNGGVQALEGKLIKHLDGDLTNNTEYNLIAVPKKGWVQELANKRIGVHTQLYSVLPTQAVPMTLVDPINTVYTDAELLARKIVLALNSGKSTKEVAEEFGVKTSKVNDVKRGKSSGRATAELRAE